MRSRPSARTRGRRLRGRRTTATPSPGRRSGPRTSAGSTRSTPLSSAPPPTEAGSASFTVVNTDTQSTTIVREWFAPAFPGLAGLYICICIHVCINITTFFCTFGDTLLIASKTKLNLVLLPSPPTIKNNIVRYQWGISSPPPSNVDGLRALKNTCRCPGSGFTGQILHPLGD